MSNHPSLSAALKRLERYRRYTIAYNPTTVGSPYVNNVSDLADDIELVTTALRLAAEIAEHTDSADGNPIFTIKLPCLWTAAHKGFLHALSQCRGKEAGDE